MNISLNGIAIKDFKGIKEQTIEFNGKNAQIYAELRIVGIGGYKTAYEVRCPNCGVGTDYDEDKQGVIDVWNTRA